MNRELKGQSCIKAMQIFGMNTSAFMGCGARLYMGLPAAHVFLDVTCDPIFLSFFFHAEE